MNSIRSKSQLRASGNKTDVSRRTAHGRGAGRALRRLRNCSPSGRTDNGPNAHCSRVQAFAAEESFLPPGCHCWRITDHVHLHVEPITRVEGHQARPLQTILAFTSCQCSPCCCQRNKRGDCAIRRLCRVDSRRHRKRAQSAMTRREADCTSETGNNPMTSGLGPGVSNDEGVCFTDPGRIHW